MHNYILLSAGQPIWYCDHQRYYSWSRWPHQ